MHGQLVHGFVKLASPFFLLGWQAWQLVKFTKEAIDSLEGGARRHKLLLAGRRTNHSAG